MRGGLEDRGIEVGPCYEGDRDVGESSWRTVT